MSNMRTHFIDEISVIIAICLVIFSMATYADNPGKAYTYAYIRVTEVCVPFGCISLLPYIG